MKKRDYDSSDKEEERDEKAVEPRHRSERLRGLHIVPMAQEPQRRMPADAELRELMEQFKHPAKNKDTSTDDLPPAA